MQKHVVGRSGLNDDGTRLIVELVLEDPQYLAEPVVHSRELRYSAPLEMPRDDRDPETTRRFLRQ